MSEPGAGMRADMAEQPAVLRELARHRGELGLGGFVPRGTLIVARGSSDYAAVFGRYLIEAATRRPVALAAPSLTTLYGVEDDLDGWLAVGVSQSGRTPEIATVLEAYGRAGARTVAVTNDASSPLAALASCTVALGAGDERAVPATKTLTAQLLAFALIAEELGDVPWSDLSDVSDAVAAVLGDPAPAEAAAAALGNADELVCLARGFLNCVALEAALKLREAAGVRAEGWSAADFRHGPMTVARGDLPVLAVSAAGPAEADVDAIVTQLRDGGTKVLRIADHADADLPFGGGLAEPLAALPATVRAQQLALAMALRRGADPDAPPGLNKVTATQ